MNIQAERAQKKDIELVKMGSYQCGQWRLELCPSHGEAFSDMLGVDVKDNHQLGIGSE